MSWKQAWLWARESSDPMLLLATIQHPTAGTLRLVKNQADITSRGDVFTASWFDVALDNDNGKVVTCNFQFPNVQPYLGPLIESIVDPLDVTLEVVSAAHPDTVVRDARHLLLRSVKIDPVMIVGQLNGWDYTSEPLGTINVIPARFPGLFRLRA